MTYSNLLQLLRPDLFAKIGFLILDLFFIIFLAVAIRQVFTMNTIVSDSHDSFLIKSLVFLLFFLAISLFLTALVIL